MRLSILFRNFDLSAAQSITKVDVVITPENIVHWHGATVTTAMTHIAITNFTEEVQVTWLQPVSDDEYESVDNK